MSRFAMRTRVHPTRLEKPSVENRKKESRRRRAQSQLTLNEMHLHANVSQDKIVRFIDVPCAAIGLIYCQSETM